VPDPPVILAEVRVHDKLVEFVVIARVAVPANPFTGATLIVEVAATPAFAVTLIRLAENVKSWTTNVTVTEWDREPLVPVTDTSLLPVEVNVQDRVALPEPVTLVGEIVQAEVLLVARLTMPGKPFRAVTMIVEVPGALTLTITLVRLAATVKSWMV
jgi:hypothetical protein